MGSFLIRKSHTVSSLFYILGRVLVSGNLTDGTEEPLNCSPEKIFCFFCCILQFRLVPASFRCTDS